MYPDQDQSDQSNQGYQDNQQGQPLAPPPTLGQPYAAPPQQPDAWPAPAPTMPTQPYETAPQQQQQYYNPQPPTAPTQQPNTDYYTPVSTPPETPPSEPETASKHSIIKAAAIAAGVATFLLIFAVLPAEYGVDPTGAGKAMGLVKLNQTGEEGEAEANTDTSTNTSESTSSKVITETPTIGSRLISKDALYKTDTIELTLKPKKSFEYKFDLDKDSAFLYSWTATGELKHEFHGEPKDGPKGSYQSYKKATETSSSGSFVAPFTGTHGWYWKNNGTKTVTITLTASGYYTGHRLLGQQ